MIPILMCGNSGVLDGITLAALSLRKTSSRPISLFIGTMDLSDLDPRFTPITADDAKFIESVLCSSLPESRVSLIDFSENFRRELIDSKNIGTGYTPYAMIRLFADECELLPDKLIYLDTDVLLAKDVAEFYDIDIEGYDLAGVRDYYGKVFIHPNYLNSGVMLWNLKRIRENGIFRRATELCRKKKMLLMDQSAINKYSKRKLILPPKYNEQHKWHEETVIQHFSMRIRWFPYFKTEKIKPWNIDLIHKKLGLFYYDDIFNQFLTLKNGDNEK